MTKHIPNSALKVVFVQKRLCGHMESWKESSVASESANPFDRLPLDLVKKILGVPGQILPLEEARRLQATCKLFYCILREERTLLWEIDQDDDAARFFKFISCNLDTRWKRIVLEDVRDKALNLADLASIFSSSVESLESFTLRMYCTSEEVKDTPIVGWNELTAMLQSCRRLKQVSISTYAQASFDGPSPAFTLTRPLSSLTDLEISTLTVSPPVFQSTLSALPKLRLLSIALYPHSCEPVTADEYIMISATLEDLHWYGAFKDSPEVGQTTSRLVVKAPRLKKLHVYTGRWVNLNSGSLEWLRLGYGVRIDTAAPMGSLKHLIVEGTDWTSLSRILQASPTLTSLDICHLHEESYPSLQKPGAACRTLRLLRFLFEAWSLIGSPVNGKIVQPEPSDIQCFRELQRLQVDLDSYSCAKQETLSRLKVIVAACKSMEQMNITVRHKDERKEDVTEMVKTLAQDYPSSWFVVEDCSVPGSSQRLIAVKSNKIYLGS